MCTISTLFAEVSKYLKIKLKQTQSHNLTRLTLYQKQTYLQRLVSFLRKFGLVLLPFSFVVQDFLELMFNVWFVCSIYTLVSELTTFLIFFLTNQVQAQSLRPKRKWRKSSSSGDRSVGRSCTANRLSWTIARDVRSVAESKTL